MSKRTTRPRPANPGASPARPAAPANVQAAAKAKARPRPAAAAQPEGSGAPAWRNWVLAVLIITALCYLPSLSNALVNWDDDPNITENPNLEVVTWQSVRDIFSLDKGAVIGNYNPLPILTFAIEKVIAGGFNTTLIHTTNLLLHLLTTFFAFRLLVRMGLGPVGAFIGALLFGIHPMRVESVAWATERKDVLFAAFFFAALLYYVRWIRTEDSGQRTRQYAVMFVLAVLSMFSKVQAVTLPLSMLALDYYFRRPINFRLILEKTPFWLLSLAFGLINIYTLRQQGSLDQGAEITNFTFVDRLCIGAYSLVVYLYKLVLPYPMSPLYPYPKPLPVTVYLAPIGALAFFGALYWLWKREQRMWVFGMLFFFFNVMFLLQILGAGQGFLADRFTYVAYFGFFAIAGWLYERYVAQPGTKSIAQGVAVAAFVAFAIMTVLQIRVWKNGETLWTHVMKFEGKTSSLPYWNRGQYFRAQGQYEASLRDYSTAIEIHPKNPELYNSRGKTYFDMAMSGKFPDKAREYANLALADYNAGLAIPDLKPKTRSEMLINRGAAYGAGGRLQDAERDLTEGISLNPDNKNGYFNRSIIYFQTQQYDKAIGDYTEYLKFDPNNANVWYERGMLRRGLKQNDAAVADLTRAIQLNPQFAFAYRERARAYVQAGNRAAAQADYQRGAQLGAPPEPLDQQIGQ